MIGGRQQGFTLLEMLVALTVFALVSVLVYTGQVAVLEAKEGVERQAAFLKQLQRTMSMLEQDLGQHILRPVRDEYGDHQPPMASSEYGDYRLSLTRAGWQNPLDLPRSTLQRVAYGLSDNALVRYSWAVLDRAHGSEPDNIRLLEGVRRLGFRFIDQQGEWQEQWPLYTSNGAARVVMPSAVEVTIELEQRGSFRRLIPLVDGEAESSGKAKGKESDA